MRKIFIIILAVVFIGFLLPSVSSLTFDNRLKSYDEETKTIIIDDNFGLGGDLVKIKLEENTYICGVECYAIWNVTIYKDDDNFLTDLIFEQVNGSNGVSEHNFEFVSGYETITVNDYGIDCTKRDELNQCKRIITGTHEEQIPIWSAFDPERKLPIFRLPPYNPANRIIVAENSEYPNNIFSISNKTQARSVSGSNSTSSTALHKLSG